MTATTLEYALMAGAAYESTRGEANKLPRPGDWQPLDPARSLDHRVENVSGFEAVAFAKGNDIVIAYAGTYEKDLDGDWVANVVLGGGGMHPQLAEAARYYQDIKRLHPNANISFTGHSLGGGLAAGRL
jgi:hypothetical protein